jgi:hypothetical protein
MSATEAGPKAARYRRIIPSADPAAARGAPQPGLGQDQRDRAAGPQTPLGGGWTSGSRYWTDQACSPGG